MQIAPFPPSDVSMKIPGKNDADRLVWLGQHRLWPVADLLLERRWISARLATMAGLLAAPSERAMAEQLVEEQRVTAALAETNVPTLVLKGALLAQTVYPRSESRIRNDLDLLVEPSAIPAAERVLAALGYRKTWDVAGGSPMEQAQWVRSDGQRCFMADLHWDLRNHPALQKRFAFRELLEFSAILPGFGESVRGMGRAHALLNASMHYFDHQGQARPHQWLLDKDLLWRAMTPDERAACTRTARERGLAGLLAESLARTRDVFDTPVSDDEIESLRTAGHGQWSTGIIRASEARLPAYWFALRSEPGVRRKLLRIKAVLFPPAAYMHQRYPDGSRFGLPGLYLRRIVANLRARPR